jgi:hypothetical protein
MKPTWDIDASMLHNYDRFQTDFFKRFVLRRAPQPLQLNAKVAKDYLFPTFYSDVTCAMAIFLCPYENAAKLMLHPRIKPVRMPLDRAIVAFSCYEYRNVLGVAPYNEIAMTIPVMVDPLVNVPVLPMLLPVFKEFGYYVFSMPVTSLENQIRGRKIWGLPKVVQDIDVREENGDCRTVAKDEEGAVYFDLRVPTAGKPTKFDVKSNLYTRLDDQLLQSETNFAATFNVNAFPQLLWQKGVKAKRPFLTLGDSPAAQPLRNLAIEEQPFQTRFVKGMSSCFDLPNPNFRSPIKFS